MEQHGLRLGRGGAWVALLGLVGTPSAARADLTEWAAAVAAGTVPRYSATNPPLHGTVDIGPHLSPQHASYEVVVRAGNYNSGAGPATSPGSALIGARNTGTGDQACVKFE